ncbi:MAG: hypothetical protein ABR552_00230, partial [Actinomycetota bacterium]
VRRAAAGRLARMTVRRRALRAAVLAASGFTGFSAAHALEYSLLVPDPIRRIAMLRATGHSYWGPAVHAAAFAAVFAAGAAFAFGFNRGRARIASPAHVRRLVAFQTTGFICVETFERIAAGAPLRAAAGVIVAGVVTQMLVAVAAACLLALLERAGARVASVLRRARFARTPRIAPLRVPEQPGHARSALLRIAPARAPPLASAS